MKHTKSGTENSAPTHPQHSLLTPNTLNVATNIKRLPEHDWYEIVLTL